MIIEKNKERINSRKEIRDKIINNESDQIDLVSRTITIVYELNREVFNFYTQNEKMKGVFREDTTKQAVHTLFRKCITQMESILILLENGKYLEAYSILRDLFETSIFLLYAVVYPFEAERWLDWAGMTFKEKGDYRQKYKKIDDFKLFLKEKKYMALLELVTPQNYRKYRDFRVGFVREQAFKKHPSIKGADFAEFYFELCKFVHPSIKSLNYNDALNKEFFRDIVADVLYIAKNTGEIYIDYFDEALKDSEIIKEFVRIKQEIENV